VIPRRTVFLGIAALILAGAGIAAAATYDDDDTPAALEQPVTTTTLALPADTTTTVAVTSTTATPAPTTTVAGARTTTTRRGATTTTAGAGATTTTTGPIAACTAGQMEAVVTTDKAAYVPGEPVKIQSTLRNRSAVTCTYPSFVFSAAILSPAGATITSFERVGESPGALGAGQQNEASVTWDRLGCAPQPCTQTPPGEYTVSATWNFPGGPYTAARRVNFS
jgi:hypothetical protein